MTLATWTDRSFAELHERTEHNLKSRAKWGLNPGEGNTYIVLYLKLALIPIFYADERDPKVRLAWALRQHSQHKYIPMNLKSGTFELTTRSKNPPSDPLAFPFTCYK